MIDQQTCLTIDELMSAMKEHAKLTQLSRQIAAQLEKVTMDQQACARDIGACELNVKRMKIVLAQMLSKE